MLSAASRRLCGLRDFNTPNFPKKSYLENRNSYRAGFVLKRTRMAMFILTCITNIWPKHNTF